MNERSKRHRSNHPSSPKSKPGTSHLYSQSESEYIYGKHTVSNHLKHKNQSNRLFIQKNIVNDQVARILKLAQENGVVYQEVPKAKLDELSNQGNHQGVVLSVPPFEYSTLEEAFDLAQAREEDPFLLILDGIEDPHNLGSILRTADAVGVHGVILPKRRSASLTGVVAKTSTGAVEHVPVIRVTNLSQTISQLKERGVWVFTTAMDGEDMREWQSHGPIALIIGNEGQGVSPLVAQSADGTVTIPMVGHVQSLNASVAAAVLMYEVARHRIGK